MSATREIAEQIVAQLSWNDLRSLAPKGLADAIDRVLQAERERCAKIAGNALERLDALNACCAEPMRAVLRAIREGKSPE